MRGHPKLQSTLASRALLVLVLAMGCDGFRQATAPPEPVTGEGPLIAQPDRVTATLTIDASILRQEMHGFGSSMRLFSDPHLINRGGTIENSLQIQTSDQDAILDVLYSEIGLTRVRPIFQSTGMLASAGAALRTDWVFADGHIDIVKRAKSRGVREWWLSPIRLEPWMSGVSAEDYAVWAMSVMRYWRTAGVELTWYSILNEPAVFGGQYSAEFLHDAVRLLGPRLRAEGFATKLVIPDDLNPRYAALGARRILSDPETRPYVAAIASHLYEAPIATMSEMSDLAKEFGVPLWMSEFSVRSTSPLAWAEVVHQLIANYDVSAVDYLWGYFGDFDGAQLVSIHHNAGRFTGASLTPAGYAMAQYARYVRPGARRVQLQLSRIDIQGTSFVRDGKVAIVVINSGSDSRGVRFSVSGVAGLRTLQLIRTSQTESLAPVGYLVVSNGSFNLELPAQSISTLIQ